MINTEIKEAIVTDKLGNEHKIVFGVSDVIQFVGMDETTGIPYVSLSVKENGEGTAERIKAGVMND